MHWQHKDSLALLGLAAFFVLAHILFDVLRYWPISCTSVNPIYNYASLHPAVSTSVEGFFSLNKWTQSFIILFLFRYTRLVVNTISFLTYKATPIPTRPRTPTQLPKDVTVIIPTVEPSGDDFEKCINSIMKNNPARIMIVTAGIGKDVEARNVCRSYNNSSAFGLFHCKVPNKRTQVCEAMKKVGPSKVGRLSMLGVWIF
jgi:hypothetical protein